MCTVIVIQDFLVEWFLYEEFSWLSLATVRLYKSTECDLADKQHRH